MSVPGGARKVCELCENGVYANPVMMRHPFPLPLPHDFHNHCHRYPHSHCYRRRYLLTIPLKNKTAHEILFHSTIFGRIKAPS